LHFVLQRPPCKDKEKGFCPLCTLFFLEMKQQTAIVAKKPLTAATDSVAEAVIVSYREIANQIFARVSPDVKVAPFNGDQYANIVAAYGHGRGIQSAVVLGNASPQGPTGHVINFKPEAPIDAVTLSPDSFEYLVMCKVCPSGHLVH
jgi:hypothetical protein